MSGSNGNAAFRAHLEKAGLLDAFDIRVEAARVESGCSVQAATKRVRKEFLHELSEMGRPYVDTSLVSKPNAGKRNAPVPPAGASKASPPAPSGGSPVSSGGGDADFSREFYEEFISRDADVLSVINWVAKHIEVPVGVLTPADAPSAEAWGMLLSYQSLSRKQDFWDKIYSKLIPSKSQLESRVVDGIDGEHIIAACDKLMSMRRKISGGSGNGSGK